MVCRRFALRFLRILALALALSAITQRADAKTEHSSPYTYRQTYGSALRLVKVDLGLKVTDQDPEWGYLMFEYHSRESGKRTIQGSFEFVRKPDEILVSLQLAEMPSYHERMIIDKLVRKLYDEHGVPPVREKKPPKKSEAKKKGDGDKDEGASDQKSRKRSATRKQD